MRSSTRAYQCVCSVVQSSSTLSNTLGCSPQGSSDHGMILERTLGWVAISCSRGSSWPKNRTHVSWVSRIGRWSLYQWATQEGCQSNVSLKILVNHRKSLRWWRHGWYQYHWEVTRLTLRDKPILEFNSFNSFNSFNPSIYYCCTISVFLVCKNFWNT